jgi:hypothetical protein
MTAEQELHEILGSLLGDVPALAALAADFDKLANRYVGEPKLHSLFSRLSTVVRDFAHGLEHAWNYISPELKARLMPKVGA